MLSHRPSALCCLAAALAGLTAGCTTTKQSNTARADDTNSYFMGFGPKQSGTLQYEVSRSTSLHPGQRFREIPMEVALGKPPVEKLKTDEPQLKLAADEKEE